MKNTIFIYITGALLLSSCFQKEKSFDATGTFEAQEVIIASESNGKILALGAEEGMTVNKGDTIARIDDTDLQLQKAQIMASSDAVGLKVGDASPQVKVLEEQKLATTAQLNTLKVQLGVLEKEQARIKAMVSSEAATSQQLDELDGKVEVLKAQIDAASSQFKILDAQIASAKSTVAIQNRGITSQKLPLDKQLEFLDYQISKASVTSPIDGMVLTKYAEENEFITMGRPLIKIADLSMMWLNAYITGPQLSTMKLGQDVEVYVDHGEGQKMYPGTISWVSETAEFTPKTIQTKEERANLVYAIKILVPNDGFLKIGMYGEVNFNNKSIADE